MSGAAHFVMPRASRPSLRPLALPTEHGGWGFLLEPILLALAVAPSPAGVLIALAYSLGFLARQPLKLALQDALRGKSYPRTRWCRIFSAAYAAGALLALAAAVAAADMRILLPLVVAAPLGAIQILYDVRNRSRSLLPELGGSVAMSSSAAAIAIAEGMPPAAALVLPAIVISRGVPAIVYVRTLLQRAHGRSVSSIPALALHLFAAASVALLGSGLALLAMLILLGRAAWQLTRPSVPPAKQIGWTEIAFGLTTVVLAAAGQLTGL